MKIYSSFQTSVAKTSAIIRVPTRHFVRGHWTSYTWADKRRAVNPTQDCDRWSHLWSCPTLYPSCKTAMLTSPLPALRWGLSSLLLSSSCIKPSVLERNGSLLLINCVYGCPWNTLVVPKGCHFSISTPYNCISIWQLLTGCRVQGTNGYKNVSETKMSCKMVLGF